ncbi:PDDEXK family nuclease [Nitrospirillum pindoramense]|uniref:Phage endonuclease I n=1 Tax=Nitrospirillum amazonense TaxID=28077 RepID=A0A560H8G3_9PROT|nr:hypothetical protein [Nitrospirillum amazonense]TWB41944.1 phage endonuclease I [Nitrospirillum amazonense]
MEQDYSVVAGRRRLVGGVTITETPYGGRVYRSKHEAATAAALVEAGLSDVRYEAERLPYAVGVYVPDFTLGDGLTIVEAKGWLSDDAQRKLIMVRDAHPERHIVLCLQNPHNRLKKGRKLTGAQWAKREGFDWATVDALADHLRAIGVEDDWNPDYHPYVAARNMDLAAAAERMRAAAEGGNEPNCA